MAHGDPLVGRIVHDALGCSALAISKMAAVKPLGVFSSGTRLVFFLVTVDIHNTNLPEAAPSTQFMAIILSLASL